MPGLGVQYGEFGSIGDEQVRYSKIVKRMEAVSQHVGTDSINAEKNVKYVANIVGELGVGESLSRSF